MPPARRSTARLPKIQTTPGPRTCAHHCYEEGDPNTARAFLASWLTTYPRNGLLYSHLVRISRSVTSKPATRWRRPGFSRKPSRPTYSGPPRAKVNDAVSVSVALGPAEIHVTPKHGLITTFANSALRHAAWRFPTCASRLAQAVAGNDAGLEARAVAADRGSRETALLPASSCQAVSARFPPLSNGDILLRSTRFEQNVLPANSNASAVAAHSSTSVVLTLLKAYLSADRLDDARRMLSMRRRAPRAFPSGSRPLTRAARLRGLVDSAADASNWRGRPLHRILGALPRM